MIKSPLRYPGGKSKAIPKIIQNLPLKFNENWEYREPFVGGGSLFIYLAQNYPGLNIWINDLNPEVYAFWYSVKNNLDELIDLTYELKNNFKDNGRGLKEYLILNNFSNNVLSRGVKFFILNRITFSGTIESGGYSESAFRNRFTESSILRLKQMEGVLDNVRITNANYLPLLYGKGKKDIFIYLDPPYLTAKNLYGKNGNLHNNFNHVKFRDYLINSPHDWLMTYDNCRKIKELYKICNIKIEEFSLVYGMKQGDIGKELLISMYNKKKKEKIIFYE